MTHPAPHPEMLPRFPQSIFRVTTSAFRRIPPQLAVALRLNLVAVLPVTVLLVVLGDRNWRGFGKTFLLVFILTNANFLVLNIFYRWVWRTLGRRRRPIAYLVLVLLILPVLGAVGGLLGKAVFDWISPGSLRATAGSLLAVNILLTTLFGFSVYLIEDLRRGERDMSGELKLSREKQRELEMARDEAEIGRLQALLKPHFVFNTLNTIAALLPEDPLGAQQATLQLAKLLRYVLETGDEAIVSLASEVNVAVAYLEIEKVRMGNRLDYRLDIPEKLLTVPMPGMLLQPLVENAVKHGVRQHHGAGYVRIRARANDRDCQIEIADNGPGFSGHQGTGQGLRLLRDRLERVYHENYELKLERDKEAAETIVTLCFSLKPRAEARA